MEDIIKKFDKNKYMTKVVDKNTSQIFLRNLSNYLNDLTKAIEPIFNNVFAKNHEIELECLLTNLATMDNDTLFPETLEGLSYSFDKSSTGSKKDEFSIALKNLSNRNDGSYELYLNYLSGAFDLVAYVKSLRFVKEKNSNQFSEVFNIQLDDEHTNLILKKLNKLRNKISHKNRIIINEFKETKLMIEQMEACEAFVELFSNYPTIKNHKETLKNFITQSIILIVSEPIPFAQISEKFPYFKSENKLLSTWLRDDYDTKTKTLYGHVEYEIQELVSSMVENPIELENDLQIENETSLLFDKSTDNVLNSLLMYENVITKSQLMELVKNCPIFIDGRLFTIEQGRNLIKKEFIPVLKEAHKYSMITYSSRLELNRMSIENEEEKRKRGEKARTTIEYLISVGLTRYLRKQENVYKKGYLEIVDIANNFPQYRFCAVVLDKTAADEIEAKTKNCLVLKPLGFEKITLGSKSKLILKDFANNSLEADLETKPQIEEKSETQYSPSSLQGTKENSNITKNTSLLQKTEKDRSKLLKAIEKSKYKISYYDLAKEKGCIPEDKENLNSDFNIAIDSTVFDENGVSLKLKEKLGQGGEGTVYNVTEKMVAKIYNKKSLTKNRYEKLKLMVKENFSVGEVCWPKRMLFDKDGIFIGYLMKKADPNYLSLGSSILKLADTSMLEYIADLKKWDRSSLASLCETIARIFRYLHEKEIIVGDINASNILVNPQNSDGTDVLFIDTDSYQIGPYPCPVGIEIFTSPEIFRKENKKRLSYGSFLRTQSEEEYTIASLFFQILFLGQVPFNSKGIDGNSLEALKEYNFAFYSNESLGKEVPDGPARMIWNNTPKYIQDAFKMVFMGEGTVSAKTWKMLFKRYCTELNKGEYSKDVIPFRYYDPEHKNTVDFECPVCHRIANTTKKRYKKITERNFWLLCPDCNLKMEKKRFESRMVYCDICDNQFEIDEYTLRFKLFSKQPIVCPECDKPIETKCYKCGKTITTKNYKYVKRKGKMLCGECLKKGK